MPTTAAGPALHAADALFDDRMQKIQRQGRMSFYMKSTGEEAVSVAAAMALERRHAVPGLSQSGLQFVRGQPLGP